MMQQGKAQGLGCREAKRKVCGLCKGGRAEGTGIERN